MPMLYVVCRNLPEFQRWRASTHSSSFQPLLDRSLPVGVWATHGTFSLDGGRIGNVLFLPHWWTALVPADASLIVEQARVVAEDYYEIYDGWL